MIAVGCLLTCTDPLAAVIVTGKAPVTLALAEAEPVAPGDVGVADVLLHPAATTASAVASAIADSRRGIARMIISSSVWSWRTKCARCDTRRNRNEPPFLRGQVVDAGQASGLVLLAEASPLRDSAGFTPASLVSATSRRTGMPESYCISGLRTRSASGRLSTYQLASAKTSRTAAVAISIMAPKTSPLIPPSRVLAARCRRLAASRPVIA